MDGDETSDLPQIGAFALRPRTGFRVLENGDGVGVNLVGRRPTDSELAELKPITEAIKAYRGKLKELFQPNGRYEPLGDAVWPHLRQRCNVIVVGCPDGFIVRQDRAEASADKSIFATTWTDKALVDAVPVFSEQLIHVRGADTLTPEAGVRLKLLEQDPSDPTGSTKTVLELRLTLETTLESTDRSDPRRADRLMFATNDIEGGMSLEVQSPNGPTQIAHLPLNGPLPVGWSAIEVYQRPATPGAWNPTDADVRADRDVLQSIASSHLAGHRIHQPLSLSRDVARQLLADFEKSLETDEREIHQFLEHHPELIVPTYTRFWSKLPLGNRLITDFVLQLADGEYLFVELERADHSLFRSDGQQTEAVTHAVNQVLDWFRYVQDNRDTLVREHALVGVSTAPKGLVVIGRSHSLSGEDSRKLKTFAELSSRLTVITYDALLENARVNFENLFGQLERAQQP